MDRCVTSRQSRCDTFAMAINSRNANAHALQSPNERFQPQSWSPLVFTFPITQSPALTTPTLPPPPHPFRIAQVHGAVESVEGDAARHSQE